MGLRIQGRDTIAYANVSGQLATNGTSSAVPVGGRAKRVMDMVIASTALVLFSPLFLLIALLVKLTDNGPVLYGHTRVGRDERLFSCLKFRTMVINGQEVLERHLANDPAAHHEWMTTRKLKNDPRVTPLGAILRKMSLDELPQLLNIVRGDMSIVGPRPVVVDEIKKYGPDAVFYIQARPGLTGPWQVSGRNDVSYDARVAFDRRYVESWSLWQDIVIILKTVPAVLSARGTY